MTMAEGMLNDETKISYPHKKMEMRLRHNAKPISLKDAAAQAHIIPEQISVL
jgi:hypothetical protein